MKRLLLLILLIPCISYGQELSVSPISTPLWGKTPETIKATFTYESLEIMYLKPYNTWYFSEGGVYNGDHFAVFWNPISISKDRFDFEGGVGYFFRKFPTVNCTNVNFQFKATYNISDLFGIGYSHISNGFGLFADVNPGIDNFSLIIKL